MRTEDKIALIETFQSLATAFDDTLHLEKAVLCFRPSADAWSIIEQVVHCADFDMTNDHRNDRS